ncbi:apolipoprotein D-like [Condylostylus longicornis]|uniref:apolipoprotein D-like n=1 Tax=Condylostylus longicornis TaxID=2530218 RepID=UPI00244DE45D|nr:apolipoprotein D-like [Condylostylus longicornis]
MNKIFLTAVTFVSIFGIINCQVPAPGKCPTGITVVSELDVEKYLGTWYEHSKYPAIFEVGGKCMQAVYGKFENGTVSVVNSQINILTGAKSSIEGHAALTEEPGKLIVNFPSVGKIGVKSNYWVLSTDYTTYSVVYSCSNLLNEKMHGTIVWILTRERTPSQEVIDKAYKVLDDNQISKLLLLKTQQDNCDA